MASDKPGFFAELKRRNVVRAAVLYVGAVWAFGQGLSQFSPALGLPAEATRWFLIACLITFPFWLAFAWFYELTPQGFRRESVVAVGSLQRTSNARKLDFAIIAVLIVAVVLLASGYFVARKPAPAKAKAAASAIPAQSIAVLPFENLSNDTDNAYFVEGMQDLILTKLADIGSLKVIARTSTARYASHPADLAIIGRQLGVATLLEGSVQKAGNAVLINVQLVKAADGAHIWAQSYQRTLDNVFGVEGEVAQKIATALNTRLSPQTASRLATALSNNPVANDLYLRAQRIAAQGQINFSTAEWKQALPLYRQALDLAPDFALALARLSSVESELAWFGGGGEQVAPLNTDACAQAEQAIRLAPDLPEAWVALGNCSYYVQADYAAALHSFEAALRLRPNDVGALAAQGYVLRRQGRFDDAIASLQQAQARDPRDTNLVSQLGTTYQLAGHYAEAEAADRQALALDPANVEVRIELSRLLLFANGDIPAALKVAAGDDPRLRLRRVSLLTDLRKYQDALTLLDGVPDTPDNFDVLNGGSKSQWEADLYFLMGDRAKARALYAEALPPIRAAMASSRGKADIYQTGAWSTLADAELGIGKNSEALAAIAKSQVFAEQARDQINGPAQTVENASLYAEAGRADLAVPLLAKALAMPGIALSYSPAMLWIDAGWDPIRHTPQFRALLKKYAKDKPAVTYDAPPPTGISGASAH